MSSEKWLLIHPESKEAPLISASTPRKSSQTLRSGAMANMGGGDSVLAASVGLRKAYEEAIQNGRLTEPKAGVMIYCGGLSIAVGDALAASLEAMPDAVPLLGVTAFGEQGWLGGANRHSNLSVGIALFE